MLYCAVYTTYYLVRATYWVVRTTYWVTRTTCYVVCTFLSRTTFLSPTYDLSLLNVRLTIVSKTYLYTCMLLSRKALYIVRTPHVRLFISYVHLTISYWEHTMSYVRLLSNSTIIYLIRVRRKSCVRYNLVWTLCTRGLLSRTVHLDFKTNRLLHGSPMLP